MATTGLSKIIRVRISEQDYFRSMAHVTSNPELYKNLSHFVRSAIIQKVNDELEVGLKNGI